LSPEGAGWSSPEYITADLFDAVQALTYATVKAAGGRARKPKPYPRPGVKASKTDTKTFGMKPMPIADLIRELGWEDHPEVQNGRSADTR